MILSGSTSAPPSICFQSSQHIASGQFKNGRMAITRRHGAPTSSLHDHCVIESGISDWSAIAQKDGNGRGNLYSGVSSSQDSELKAEILDYSGYEEEAIVFPQSTHSWLFTEEIISLPFVFAAGIATISYFCLVLALLNVFEDGEPENPFNAPYQVQTSVRIAQYLAWVIFSSSISHIVHLFLKPMIRIHNFIFPPFSKWTEQHDYCTNNGRRNTHGTLLAENDNKRITWKSISAHQVWKVFARCNCSSCHGISISI